MIPKYRVTLGGRELTELERSKLVSISCTDDVGYVSDVCSLTFSDDDGIELPNSDDTRIVVTAGYLEDGDLDLWEIGSYVLDDIDYNWKGNIKLIGKGFDSSNELKTFTSRRYESKKIGEFLEEIAKDNNLKLKVEPSLADITIVNPIVQVNESYLNLLTRKLTEYSLVFKIITNNLVVTKRGSSKTGSGQQLPPVVIRPDDIISLNYKAKGRENFKSAAANYRDIESGQTKPVRTGIGSPRFRFQTVFDNEIQALEACKAKLRESTFKSEVVTLTIKRARRNIIAETPVVLEGFKQRLNIDWTIKNATHNIVDKYTMTLKLERNTESIS